jgi:hypothetical protein
MGNKSTTGIFVPLVKLVRAAVGKSQFNQLRGKGISLHSQGNFVMLLSPVVQQQLIWFLLGFANVAPLIHFLCDVQLSRVLVRG